MSIQLVWTGSVQRGGEEMRIWGKINYELMKTERDR